MMNMSHNATCRVVMLGVDCCSIQGSLRLHLPTDQIKRDSHLCVCVWLQWRQLHPAVCLSANWPQYIMNTAQSDREWERETVSHSNTRSNNCFYFSLFPSSHWHTHTPFSYSVLLSIFFLLFFLVKSSHLVFCIFYYVLVFASLILTLLLPASLPIPLLIKPIFMHSAFLFCVFIKMLLNPSHNNNITLSALCVAQCFFTFSSKFWHEISIF